MFLHITPDNSISIIEKSASAGYYFLQAPADDI